MSSFLSSLNLSPFALVAVGLIVLAVVIVLLVVWVIAIDRRTRGVVDGLEVERRKVAEMQVIVSQRVGRGPQRPQGRSGPGARGAGRAGVSAAAGASAGTIKSERNVSYEGAQEGIDQCHAASGGSRHPL